ncbi:MAG: hypothetical protein HYX57_08440 [Chloroflexi bacterium]|nr:hypothetical protein [Chloroflexota bacterium]
MTFRLGGLAGLLLVAAACGPAPSTTPRTSLPATGGDGPSPSVTASAGPTPSGAAPSPSPEPSPSPVTGIVPGSVDRTSLGITASYAVDATIAVRTGSLDVTTVITARNDSGDGIDRLELNTIAAALGGMVITGATVDGGSVSPTVADQTILVPLGGILPAGASTTVRIAYQATLRRGLAGSDWMFTRSNGTLAMYRWIPWISRAVPFDRPNQGDPFVTPSSPSVEVELLTDQPMVLAAPAADLVKVAAGAGSAWSFTMQNVRDVSLVLAPDFRLTEREVGGVAIRAYARPGGLSGDRLVSLAEHAISAESRLLNVAYPLPALTVVETEGGFGLESPGLIWIPDDADATNLAYIVHHETAHQWFYGVVGSDQQAEPFADEAAADLLARTALGTIRRSRCAEDDLDRAITAYTRACYYEVIYVQGGLLLDAIRRDIGTERFWTALRGYIEANRNGLSGTKALLDVLRAASPVDLLPLLESRFPSLY